MDDVHPGARPGDERDQPVRLADRTTLRLGGPARSYVEVTSEAELVAAVSAADRLGEPVLVLGGGSNLVVSDNGFDGLVVAVRTRGIAPSTDGVPGGSSLAATVEVAAGEPWDVLVERAVAEGWAGVEGLSGIPGLVGASPIQNVGAYGQEVAGVITQVRVWDRATAAIRSLSAAECRFGYRTSRFKTEPGRFLVLAVRFVLPHDASSMPIRYAELADCLAVDLGGRVPLAEARAAVLALRAGKGMLLDPDDHDTWSAGSFFMNPVLDAASYEVLRTRSVQRFGPAAVPPSYPGSGGSVKTSAAWLIERAGFTRGYGDERVRLSTKHTLALTNRGAATTADLVALAGEIRAGVAAAFGVRLTPEPVLVGATLPLVD
ncbi:MAG: UDP-N-acetylmuramate dehydrogenase [Sporichthyaceae bacterium]|nr:UDP-N-acetylmuramate dehydrogenase [Sporichthyaceae bacterium]